jgi:hypothetical protein
MGAITYRTQGIKKHLLNIFDLFPFDFPTDFIFGFQHLICLNNVFRKLEQNLLYCSCFIFTDQMVFIRLQEMSLEKYLPLYLEVFRQAGIMDYILKSHATKYICYGDPSPIDLTGAMSSTGISKSNDLMRIMTNRVRESKSKMALDIGLGCESVVRTRIEPLSVSMSNCRDRLNECITKQKLTEDFGFYLQEGYETNFCDIKVSPQSVDNNFIRKRLSPKMRMRQLHLRLNSFSFLPTFI